MQKNTIHVIEIESTKKYDFNDFDWSNQKQI